MIHFERFILMLLLVLVINYHVVRTFKKEGILEFFQTTTTPTTTSTTKGPPPIPANKHALSHKPTLPAAPGCIVRGDGTTYCDLDAIRATEDFSLQFILNRIGKIKYL